MSALNIIFDHVLHFLHTFFTQYSMQCSQSCSCTYKILHRPHHFDIDQCHTEHKLNKMYNFLHIHMQVKYTDLFIPKRTVIILASTLTSLRAHLSEAISWYSSDCTVYDYETASSLKILKTYLYLTDVSLFRQIMVESLIMGKYVWEKNTEETQNHQIVTLWGF